MFEEPEAREKIKKIFSNISTLEEDLVPCFKKSLINNEPIGLYIATEDQSDITWLFGTEDIAPMLGGDDTLKNITDQLLPSEEDKKEGVVFAVLKKVGPLYAIRLEKDVLSEVFLN
tara:strand:+ start:4907 stop:5254 length:348 start_codon:yes stop_codon:yes gene_type:complete